VESSSTSDLRLIGALLTPCLPERDGRRVSRLEMGLVANQACSPEDGGEHKNPANLLETPWFQVSPPVNPLPACRPCRIRDSSQTSEVSPGGSLDSERIFLQKRPKPAFFPSQTTISSGSCPKLRAKNGPFLNFFGSYKKEKSRKNCVSTNSSGGQSDFLGTGARTDCGKKPLVANEGPSIQRPIDIRELGFC
jgi:hypothetical protein